MKQAIITGASGFIASYLTNQLTESGVEVLALGRRNFEDILYKRLKKNKKLTYINLEMNAINNLIELAEKNKFIIGNDCVFYHFAWSGKSKLSDLDVDHQLKNIDYSINAFLCAEKMKCDKFIFVGSMEELFAKKYLALNFKKDKFYNRHVIYALSKLLARKALQVISINKNIPLICTTNSHVMGPLDDKDSFLQVTLEKIIKNDDLIFSTGQQFFDVIAVKDCANAYKLIGEKGIKNQEYWVGSGDPKPLRDYVERMCKIYSVKKKLQFGRLSYNDISLKKEDFLIDNLVKDTGFHPLMTYEDIVRELFIHLKNNQIKNLLEK